MAPATQIRDLLKRDLSETIEEIIKVTQVDEETVYREITEYVATRSIRANYTNLLRAIADYPSDPHESIGVWVSGFFGSGKSSFAKLLGYVLANRTVRGHPAADLFKQQVGDEGIAALVDVINTRLPTEVIMFDVSVDRAVRDTKETIAEVIYHALLTYLGYATDFDIAELEIELEAEGKLDEFMQRCAAGEGQTWEKIRKGAQRFNRASATLHAMDPAIYPAADSWARSLAARPSDVTVKTVVDRAFELTARRRPGKALTIIIDEVGQYVARSAEKIEDLRAIVEQFGKESRNRMRAGTAIAPVWLIVTSQEKLDEVVAALDSKRVELAKVQDRFRFRVDLSPADIREVATRRVLDKRPDATAQLKNLFDAVQGQLNTSCHLDSAKRKSEVSEYDFVQFYPYLPHFIELSVDIVSGIRLEPGAPRHLGGSNRTIIKQAHEMLVSPRTNLANQRVGRLVTLDLIYELVEGNLSSEKQKDISDIVERFRDDAQDAGWAMRVGKAIALLEFVRDLPRTEQNIAATLVDAADEQAPIQQVHAALERLLIAQFIRRTDEGYKLLTVQEKRWDDERKGYLEPKPRERNEIKRAALAEIFHDAKLRTYTHQGLHTFKVNVTVDETQIESGDIPLALLVADDGDELREKLDQARSDSRSLKGRQTVYYVFSLTPEIDDLIANAYASNQMVTKYQQIGAQSERSGDVTALLEGERREQHQVNARLRSKLEDALCSGEGIFVGTSHDGSDLGKTLPDIVRSLFERAVPELYPHLEMGARRLTGDEAEEILRAANLNALPQVFYAGQQGLGLVIREDATGKSVPNVQAPIAQEVLRFLLSKQQYGDRVTGKDLEKQFTGLGYGWDLDVIKLTLAVLLRAGAIEVTSQGRHYHNAQDLLSRAPLTNNVAFRNASFAPRDAIDLRMLTAAVRNYEELTGDEVDVEEGAIAEALKRLADDELHKLQPVIAQAQVQQLPVVAALQAYEEALRGIQAAASDDCVRQLAGEGVSFKAQRDTARRIREALEHDLPAVLHARAALDDQWPPLRERLTTTQLGALRAEGVMDDEAQVLATQRRAQELGERADQLRQASGDEAFYTRLTEIRRLTEALASAYADAYAQAHAARYHAYTDAIDGIQGSVAWMQTSLGAQDDLLAPLTSHRCSGEAPDLAGDATTCQHCHATLAQMDSDVAALNGMSSQVVVNIRRLVAPPAPEGEAPRTVRRVRASEFFGASLDSERAVDEALARFKDRLYKLVAEGATIVVE